MNERSFAAQLAEDLGPDDVRLVLSVFEADVARLTGALKAALDAGDPTAFRRAAHGLAGAAGAVGASALEQGCRAAMTAQASGTAEMTAAYRDIGAMADAALAELAVFVRGLGSAG